MLVRSEFRTHDLPRHSPVHNQVSHQCTTKWATKCTTKWATGARCAVCIVSLAVATYGHRLPIFCCAETPVHGCLTARVIWLWACAWWGWVSGCPLFLKSLHSLILKIWPPVKWMEAEKNESILYSGLLVDCGLYPGRTLRAFADFLWLK